MPTAARPAPVTCPRPAALPIRIPIREACVLVGGEILSIEEWTERRPPKRRR